MAGIGNIYADEALFQAGVHPLRPAGELTPAEVRAPAPGRARPPAGRDRLRRSVDRPLPRLARAGRGRCRTCCACTCTPASPARAAARRIVKTRVGGRGTYHCPRCQPAPGRADRRPRRAGSATRPTPAGGTGCTVVLPPRGHGRGGRRARRRSVHPRDRPALAARHRDRGDGRPADRGQRVRPVGGRRRRALVRGARTRPRRRASPACPSCRRRSSSTSASPATRGGPGPTTPTRPARPPRRGRTRWGASAPGPARRWASCSARTGGARAGWARRRVRLRDGTTVAALAVVNAFGDVLDERGEVLAGAWSPGRGFVRAARSTRCASRRSTRAWPPRQTPRSPWWPPTPGWPRPRRRRWRGWPTAGVCRAVSPGPHALRRRRGLLPGHRAAAGLALRVRRRGGRGGGARRSGTGCGAPPRCAACPTAADRRAG